MARPFIAVMLFAHHLGDGQVSFEEVGERKACGFWQTDETVLDQLGERDVVASKRHYIYLTARWVVDLHRTRASLEPDDDRDEVVAIEAATELITETLGICDCQCGVVVVPGAAELGVLGTEVVGAEREADTAFLLDRVGVPVVDGESEVRPPEVLDSADAEMRLHCAEGHGRGFVRIGSTVRTADPCHACLVCAPPAMA